MMSLYWQTMEKWKNMKLEDITNDKDLMKTLTSLHKTMTALLKDDVDHNQITYTEKEVGLTANHIAVNEHIAHNRLKKINNLKSLFENWEAFKTYYKEDNILNKIGEEFIKGKLKFDDNLLKEIQEYPFKKQVLYYFTKNNSVQMPEVTGKDYDKFKERMLPEIELNAKKHIERKDSLLQALATIKSDKSQKNLEKMWVLHSENPLGKVDGEVGTFLSNVMTHVKAGDFKYEQNGSNITIQIPIAGVIENAGVKEKINSSIFSVDLKNPQQYTMQVGTLENPKMSVIERMKGIRDDALSQVKKTELRIVK